MIGKKIKIERFKKNKSFMIILPLDHAITQGVLTGIENPLDLLSSLDNALLNATILNKGWVMKDNSYKILNNIPFFIHLSASTNLSTSNKKVLTTSITESIKLGADGVSIHINFDDIEDNLILSEIGQIVREANKYSLPVLAMIYTKNLSEYRILHMSRIVEELGVDFIKLPYYNKNNFLKKLSSIIRIPILIAGGELRNNFLDFLKRANNSIGSGAYGVIAGRNIFQRNNPNYCLYLLNEVLSKKISIDNINKNDKRLGIKND